MTVARIRETKRRLVYKRRALDALHIRYANGLPPHAEAKAEWIRREIARLEALLRQPP